MPTRVPEQFTPAQLYVTAPRPCCTSWQTGDPLSLDRCRPGAGVPGPLTSCTAERPCLTRRGRECDAMDALKFVVLDEEDLEVASTHLQDAVVRVSDVLWRPHERRLVVALNRFDWECAQSDIPEFRRRRA